MHKYLCLSSPAHRPARLGKAAHGHARLRFWTRGSPRSPATPAFPPSGRKAPGVVHYGEENLMRKWRRVTRHLKTEAYAVYLAARIRARPGRCGCWRWGSFSTPSARLISFPTPFRWWATWTTWCWCPSAWPWWRASRPPEVMAECRARAAVGVVEVRRVLWIAAAVVCRYLDCGGGPAGLACACRLLGTLKSGGDSA